MKNSTVIFSLFFSLSSLCGYSQKAKLAEADKQFDQYAYVDAITIYERVAEKGYKEEQLFQKLGNANYFNAKLENAAKWYGELFKMNSVQESEYYYRYSQALKSIGDYNNADTMLEQFNVKSGNDQRAKLYLTHKNYLEEIEANSGRFDVSNAGINSELSDFGSSFFHNKVIFSSSRETRGISKKISKRTNQPFTNLFGSERYADGTLAEPQFFGDIINDKFNESTPVFTKDGNTMYFTRNNYLDGKRGEDDQKSTLLKIYKATLEGGKWSNIVELAFNSDQYSIAHPALSTDEKTLYFASDMPGTIGQSDLYKVAIKDDGSFGKPENLGKTINTEGKETFPFISEENELYFASDGRPGLGGLDIFVSKLGKDNVFKEIQNVGAPVNGPQDDFAFIIDSKSRKGFFTSNRDGGKGFDDIYRFTENLKLDCNQELTGIITDQETGEVLTDFKVSLFDENFQLVTEYSVQGKGLYRFDVICGRNYHVRAQKIKFETTENNVTIGKTIGKTYLNLALERRIKPIGVGTDLAKTVNISIIYFDLDKWNIRQDAAFQLEKVVEVMKQFPTIKIEVRSFTDSRQSAQYNLNLSNKRAKATMQWLIKEGIEASRLTCKGYGETQLVNACSDGVNCTEEEHQANRRSEFIIMSMK